MTFSSTNLVHSLGSFFFGFCLWAFTKYIISVWYADMVYVWLVIQFIVFRSIHIALHTTLRVYVNSKQGKRWETYLGLYIYMYNIPSSSFVMIYKYCSRLLLSFFFSFNFFSECLCVNVRVNAVFYDGT